MLHNEDMYVTLIEYGILSSYTYNYSEEINIFTEQLHTACMMKIDMNIFVMNLNGIDSASCSGRFEKRLYLKGISHESFQLKFVYSATGQPWNGLAYLAIRYLKRPKKVATDVATTVCEELGWL